MATSVGSWIEYTKPMETIVTKCSDSYKQASSEGREDCINALQLEYEDKGNLRFQEKIIRCILLGKYFKENYHNTNI
jgi:hypothetical protein